MRKPQDETTSAAQGKLRGRPSALHLTNNRRSARGLRLGKPSRQSLGTWAAADILKDVLPIDARLSPDTIRRHLSRAATRMEAELAEERFSYIETSAVQREQLPNPEGPITVGIDGGYVKSREEGQTYWPIRRRR